MRKVEIQGTSVAKLLAAAMIAIVGAGSANADDWTIDLRGYAGEVCSLPPVGTTTFDFDTGGKKLVGDDAKVKTETREVFKIDSASCNYSVGVRLTSTNGALLNVARASTTPPSGMTKIIKYQATVSWGSSFTVNADGSNDVSETEGRGPISAPLTISITPIDDTKVLLEGTYTDTLTLSISAGI